ncbi:unnamed protein product, partial [Brachionus calyciflorus]
DYLDANVINSAYHFQKSRLIEDDNISVVDFRYDMQRVEHLTVTNEGTLQDVLSYRNEHDLKNLRAICLYDLKTQNISNNIFPEFDFLKELEFNYCMIKEAKDYYFQGLIQLEKLVLYETEFYVVSRGFLNGIYSLQNLKIYNNQLGLKNRINEFCSTIDQKTFTDNENLISLDLENTLVQQINDFAFENLTFLNTIRLIGNNIKIITKNTFTGLVNLIILNLSKNQISTIEYNSFISLGKLEELDLSSNFISNVESRMFNGLVKLKFLDLSKNRILNIDDNMYELFKNCTINLMDRN